MVNVIQKALLCLVTQAILDNDSNVCYRAIQCGLTPPKGTYEPATFTTSKRRCANQ
jgi:hypothetical protein